MVVAEFYTEDLEKATRLKKKQILEGLSEIGAPAIESEDKKKLIVELTPDRLDLVGFAGIVRALLSFYKKRKTREYKALASKCEIIVDKNVSKIRPYTVWGLAKGMKMGGHTLEYLIQLQDKLDTTIGRKVKKLGIGFYPSDKIAFPIYYTARKPEEIVYQPLYYPNKANAKEVLEKHPKGKEHGWIIQDFDHYPVFLDAKKNVLCLIPICNAKEYGEVTEETTDVLVEVTGTDLNACLGALEIISCELIDSGATIHKIKMKYPGKSLHTPILQTKKTKLKPEFVNRTLGTKFSLKEMQQLLQRMDIGYRGGVAETPPYRLDIMHPVDIVEDIAIAYGYNNLKPTLPNFFSVGKTEQKTTRIHAIMRGMGFVELESFILSSSQRLEEYGYGKIIDIWNPVSAEFATTRPSLIPGLVETFLANKVKGLPQKLYEVGRAYEKEWRSAIGFGIMDKKVAFSTVRGYLQTLMKELGRQFKLKKIEKHPYLEPEHSSEIWIKGKRRGIFGKVDPGFLKKKQLDFEVYVGEIELD